MAVDQQAPYYFYHNVQDRFNMVFNTALNPILNPILNSIPNIST